MQINLSGKTAVVSGSTLGIGFAAAKGLAQAGATVIVNGRKEENVGQAVRDLKKLAPKAVIRGVAADLGSAEGCAKLVAAEPDADILVNNVGIFEPKDFFDIPDSEWERFFQVNVMSGVRLSRAYAPKMLAKEWGRVIFISSESALNIPREMIQYGFTKTAQLAISRGLAKRLAGSGVTVNAILPGPTLSEGVETFFKSMLGPNDDTSIEEVAANFVQNHRPSSIIQRAASVDEVANMIVYVASPLSSATTGAALRVEGGIIDTIA